MSNQISEFKCPNCGGPLKFDSDSQMMKCPFCDSSFTMEEFNRLANIDESKTQPVSVEPGEWETNSTSLSEDENAQMTEYVCNSCGGTIITDQTTSASACPYCGNPVVMREMVSGQLKPDLVIPFKLDKEAAKEGLRNHLKGKKLLPRVFSSENHIDEIKGIYVPFWIFDADTDSDAKFHGEVVRTWSEGDYDVIKTDYYELIRGGTMSFGAVPVDGSTKMPDEMMEALEPFDVSEAVPFTLGYLSGFYADKYDVDQAVTFERAKERIRNSVSTQLEHTITSFSSVRQTGSTIRFPHGTARYVLYPVWFLNTHWNGNTYTFAMNGQTGKFIGDLPLDRHAARMMMLKTTLITVVIIMLLWGIGVAGGM